MKRALLTLAVLITSTTFAFAQSKVNINESAILKKIEKADSDTANAKKASNPATWVTRGDAMTDAATAVINNLYEMDDAMLTIMFGNAKAESVEINGAAFAKKSFPYFDAYLDASGNVRGWVLTKEVYPNAVDEALKSYAKAVELNPDAKVSEKIAAGLDRLNIYYYNTGSRLYNIRMYEGAADAFAEAYRITSLPGYVVNDESIITSLAHDTGLAYFFAKNYSESSKFFRMALEKDYGQNGDIYSLLYNSMAQEANDTDEASAKTLLEQAKVLLEQGMKKYPSNDGIIEGLTDVYARLGIDLNEIAPLIKNAIKEDPNNPALWNSLGRVYENNKDYDNAIEAYGKVSELLPDNAQFVYAVGFIYAQKAQDLADKFYMVSFSNNAEREAELKKINDIYLTGLEYAERAHQMDSENIYYVNLMKIITFRLRTTSDEMQNKYDTYEALYQSMMKDN